MPELVTASLRSHWPILRMENKDYFPHSAGFCEERSDVADCPKLTPTACSELVSTSLTTVEGNN